MKSKALVLAGILLVVVLIVGGMFVSGYNQLTGLDQAVRSSWGQVENVYQRRADLVPNLVETVKGAASFERETLKEVTEARSRAGGQLNVNASDILENPAQFEQFQRAQQDLGRSLSRLMVVSERYPDLKATQNFRDLQAQLEGTENRIAVARQRYIKSVQDYNTTVRQFPANLTAMVFGYKPKPNFTVENEAVIAKPPTVDFNKPAPAGAQPPAAPKQ